MNAPLVTPLVMLVDDEADFVETMTKRLGEKRFGRNYSL